MTRIVECCTNQDIQSWIKTKQEQIEQHIAWHESVDAMQAEKLLEQRGKFAYLLRRGEVKDAYYISFVKEDGGIKHQRFTLEHDRRGWYYKNGCNCSEGPTEIIEKTLEELIPKMIHCDPKKCSPLSGHTS